MSPAPSSIRPFLRAGLSLLAALAAGACASKSDAPTTPAVPMPQLDSAIENSTPEAASRGMSNKTWLWNRGGGPAQIHYSAADGTDYAWLVGEARIWRGEWQVRTAPDASGQPIVQICLRHPGARQIGLSGDWTCRPAGTTFYEMQEREAGDPLRIAGRTTALFILDRPPQSLAEIQARVRGN